MKKGIREYTTWKVGDYILQLSVVILGIIVTFAGSDALQERAKEKEVSKALQIVKSELELNRQEVAQITEMLEQEQSGGRYLMLYESNIGEADADSLRMFLHCLFYSQAFNYTDDALEMLKASSLVQQIRNKELVLEIMKAYSRLREFSNVFKWYYNAKEKYGDRLNLDPVFVRQNEELVRKGNVYEIWKYRFTNIHVHNLVRFAAFGVGFEERIVVVQEALGRAIEMIDQEYGLK